jgi:hypothetical protein
MVLGADGSGARAQLSLSSCFAFSFVHTKPALTMATTSGGFDNHRRPQAANGNISNEVVMNSIGSSIDLSTSSSPAVVLQSTGLRLSRS